MRPENLTEASRMVGELADLKSGLERLRHGGVIAVEARLSTGARVPLVIEGYDLEKHIARLLARAGTARQDLLLRKLDDIGVDTSSLS